MRVLGILIGFSFGLAGCALTPLHVPPPDIDQRIEALMSDYDAASVGIGIIRNGELVWTGYYGQEAPGIPTSSNSMFNTASTNKAVTAETALRLAARGEIDLDEPISAYYIHPDIADDPRHKRLTPRLLLTHQAGFLNWPYLYEDEKLAFIDEPGNGNYHYSGIGFRILANFLEVKLDKPFPQIVREEIFDPIGMMRATNSHDDAKLMGSVVMPLDENGNFQTDYELETDYWSAADDLFVTVEDYAAFLISIMNATAVTPELVLERQRVQTELAGDILWGCGDDGVTPCPSPYGHGIGWFVFGYEQGVVLHHGGNDQSEAAIGYFQPDSRNGGVIFVNSRKGVQLWPKIVDIVDPDQEFQTVFHALIKKFFSGK